MGIAAVSFRWTPDVFFRSTPHEFWAAIEAHREIHKRDED
jgi:hypothetical protein